MFSYRYFKITQILAKIKDKNWAITNQLAISIIDLSMFLLIVANYVALCIVMRIETKKQD